MDESKAIRLKKGENGFSLEFTALHFARPAKNLFAFRLDPFDSDWTIRDAAHRTATYTNLNPGVYTFRVKASNNDGVWNENPAVLQIILESPFTETPGFRIAFAVSAAIGLVLGGRWWIVGMRKRRRTVEAITAERDMTLQAKAKELEAVHRRLGETHSLLHAANVEYGQSKAMQEKADADLKRVLAEFDAFSERASRDLQEPLRLIAGAVSRLAKRNKGTTDPEANAFIASAVQGTLRLQQMINDLLSYSRIAIETKPFDRVDPGNLLDRVLANMKIGMAEKKARVTRDPLPAVSGDAVQIELLFRNLLANAFHFVKGHAPRVHLSADRQEDGMVRFSIQDNGTGVAEEYHERIFGIFERVNPNGEREGTGMGLAIAKKIVERHGGRIWVESEPGRGSTFFFTLPKA
jgi:signal transduction histidine kinase